jgi:nicotinamidase-related amidase
MKRPVLLVIDMLNDFLAKWKRGRRDGLIQPIQKLVETMRRLELPVICPLRGRWLSTTVRSMVACTKAAVERCIATMMLSPSGSLRREPLAIFLGPLADSFGPPSQQRDDEQDGQQGRNHATDDNPRQRLLGLSANPGRDSGG